MSSHHNRRRKQPLARGLHRCTARQRQQSTAVRPWRLLGGRYELLQEMEQTWSRHHAFVFTPVLYSKQYQGGVVAISVMSQCRLTETCPKLRAPPQCQQTFDRVLFAHRSSAIVAYQPLRLKLGLTNNHQQRNDLRKAESATATSVDLKGTGNQGSFRVS